MNPSRQDPAKHGLARTLSKLGFCSRTQGRALVQERRVRVNGAVCLDPERPTDPARDRIEVDNQLVRSEAKVYLMLNKPRGLVTTRVDEQGRGTIYDCLQGGDMPWVAPVGRLDKASEGLLLLTNDTIWADRLLDPAGHVDKTYHVQIDCLATPELCQLLIQGRAASDGEFLQAKRVQFLRSGVRNSWLEITLDEGKNRHIRRLLEAMKIAVLRLVRVAMGPLPLGDLPKGRFRHLTSDEVRQLTLP